MTASIDGLLVRHDLRLLGAAHTAFAFAPPDDLRHAINVGLVPADGWPAWADRCRANPGPHVPRAAKLAWFPNGGLPRLFVAAVERLFPTIVGARWIRACLAGRWNLGGPNYGV